ncbi:hypothetical protein DS901_14050 [Loktanella sp. D2R18]|uniref:hypothetical protein n=1 Tax=Rhodobacterales TaxID=204455 RepID=UPI000DE88FB2|nr:MULTISPECIES: hypothetical protein [Rhodobacterales]MDO6588905.1 hypothetical protein [Yoonia sp. 1_MG-2023]RBW41875.1 hypothetical protein DS901_14050 [Loktanella sp. D2R18]
MAKLRAPLTLRLAFHAVRAAWVGLILFIVAWIWLVPATPMERDALSAPIGINRPEGLTAMRIARAMVHFAPERAAKLLSDASNGDISPELAGMLLRQVASGAPQPPATAPQPALGDDIDGPKFISRD